MKPVSPIVRTLYVYAIKHRPFSKTYTRRLIKQFTKFDKNETK